MRRSTKDEVPAAALDDIEEGTIKKNCFACGSRNQRMVKLAEKGNGHYIFPVKTKTEIGVCTNATCYRYLAPKAVETWVPASEVLPNEQPMGADRRGVLA